MITVYKSHFLYMFSIIFIPPVTQNSQNHLLYLTKIHSFFIDTKSHYNKKFNICVLHITLNLEIKQLVLLLQHFPPKIQKEHSSSMAQGIGHSHTSQKMNKCSSLS